MIIGTYNTLVHSSLGRRQIGLCFQETRMRSGLRGIELGGDLVLDVLEDVLLHQSIEHEVCLSERAEGYGANELGVEVEQEQVGEFKDLEGNS